MGAAVLHEHLFCYNCVYMPSKRCCRCGVVKGLAEYHRNRTNHDGLHYHCKDCQRKYVRQHYERNKQYYLDKARIRNRAVAREARAVLRLLKDVPCADCCRRYPPWVMQFDHVQGVKLFDLGRGLSVSVERVRLEAAKCEVVCSNCHADRTYRRLQEQP